MNTIINTFKLLSDETRLRIILLLNQEELCVCQLTGILEISQPKASKALSKLRDLNLVIDNRQEKFVYYSLNHNNPMMMHILEYVDNNLSQYLQLTEDKSKLHLKESFLIKCSTTQLKV